MIFGVCPYCDNPVSTALAPKCPAMSKEKCDNCGEVYWLLHSRVAPVAYPRDMVEVDEETKSVKVKEAHENPSCLG